jgi:16S rRNA G1207 methylase RsmC
MEKYIEDLWKNGGSYTHREDLYLKHLKQQLPDFNGGVVLEVGPGSGKFASELIKQYPITKYYILDLEKNINDSVTFLKDVEVEVVPIMSQNYKELFNINFDLIVSNVCIPETPKAYRED